MLYDFTRASSKPWLPAPPSPSSQPNTHSRHSAVQSPPELPDDQREVPNFSPGQESPRGPSLSSQIRGCVWAGPHRSPSLSVTLIPALLLRPLSAGAAPCVHFSASPVLFFLHRSGRSWDFHEPLVPGSPDLARVNSLSVPVPGLSRAPPHPLPCLVLIYCGGHSSTWVPLPGKSAISGQSPARHFFPVLNTRPSDSLLPPLSFTGAGT